MPDLKKKIRADVALVERDLAPTRARARALILAGDVFSGEQRIEKAGEVIRTDAPLSVRARAEYVSRGGSKLAGALDALTFDPRGVVAADIGASTGGFTDCLLQRGATKVYAIDVGYGQLHPKLRENPHVVAMERTNARHLTSLPDAIDLVVIDASFIGLEKLLPAARAILREAGDLIALVKPQFQVARRNLKGGVVRDKSVRHAAIDTLISSAREIGFKELGRTDSILRGPKGNQETFVWLRPCQST